MGLEVLGSFRKLGGPYLGVLIVRILLSRVQGTILGSPIFGNARVGLNVGGLRFGGSCVSAVAKESDYYSAIFDELPLLSGHQAPIGQPSATWRPKS